MLILFYSVCRAKARPSKKAWTTNPLEDPVAEEEEPRGEPEKTCEPEGRHPEATSDDPPLEGQNTDEPTDAEPAAPDTEPAAPNQASPMRDAETPLSPAKNTEGQGDDVIITGMGHNSPGHPVTLAQHCAKEEQAAGKKANGVVIYQVMLISMLKNFTLASWTVFTQTGTMKPVW